MNRRLFAPIVAAMIVTTACGAATTPGAAPGQKPAGAITVSVLPAKKTNIGQTLTYTGDVASTSEVSVTPRGTGRIIKLPVDVGSRVQAGDLIAQLEHTTLDLNRQQAQAALQAAQAKVSTIQAGPRPENVQQAQLSVDSAQARLNNLMNGSKPAQIAEAAAAVTAAQARLAALEQPRQETVAQARLQVNQAQQRLAQLENPRPEVVNEAQLALDQAQQKLATVQAGAKPQAVDQATAVLAAAQARLQALKNGIRPADITPLDLAVTQAKNALYAAQVNRDGACNSNNVQYLCNAANAQVNTAQSAVDQAVANLHARTAAPTQTDLLQAQAAVDQAQAALDLAKQPYTIQDVQQAQDAVKQAQQQLALTKQPASPQDLQQAKNAVQIAQEQLALAERPASANDIRQGQAAVDQAVQQLTLVRQPYTADDIRQSQDAVGQAVQQLDLAKNPYTPQDLQAAQAGVAQALANVDTITQAIKDTTITAPFSGVVTQKFLSVGALVSPATPIVTLASGAVKVEVPVAEAQVSSLKLGQPATIAGGALAGHTVTGKVTMISPSENTKNRTFTTDVAPESNGNLLRPGMFVTVTITVAEHLDVTAVPSSAIVQRSGKPYVFVVQHGVARLTPVTPGLSNDHLTEVTAGLGVGASVVVEGQQDLNDGDHVTVVAGQQPAAG